MKDKGGEEELVMFLSSMGGTGKGEVIKLFVHFAKGISFAFGWNYDNDVIKITALTGSAACEIPNGRTLHSQACLTSRKIPLKLKDSWNTTKMLIIDEVSLSGQRLLYLFACVAFSMLLVRGSQLLKVNTL